MRSALVVAAAVVLLPGLGVGQQTATSRPLSLAEALGRAEGESETVGLARAEVTRAAGVRRQARSGYFPQLSGTASYTRTLRSQFSVLQDGDDTTTTSEPTPICSRFTARPELPLAERIDSLEAAVECASASDPFASFRNLPFGRENEYRLGLALSQNLFTGGRLGGQLRAANAGLRSAELGVTAARAQLLLDVTQAYYDAALGDRLVAIAEATLQQADTTFVQTRLAQQVGNQSEFELLRSQVTRDNQRPVVIQRRADRDLAYYRLKQLLNLPLDEPLQLTTELGDTALVEVTRLNELVRTPGDTAPDARGPVQQASATVEAQRGLLRVAQAQHLPQLVLSSQFARLGYPSDPSPFSTDFVSDWTVSVGVQLPIFTGGRIRGEVQAAEAGVTQAQLRLRQTRELAQLDARSAGIQLESSRAAWEASVGTVEQATRAYSIAEVRFREGISTQTELLDSRIQLEQAQAARARAARDLQVAKMRLTLLPALPLGGTAATSGQAVGSPSGITVPLSTPRPSAPTQQQTISGISTGIPQAGAVGQ